MSHTYKTNYLKQVIFRLDFEKVDLGSFTDFTEYKVSEFTEAKKNSGKSGGLEVDFDSGEVKNSLEEIEIWQFTDPKQNNKFEVGPQHCLLEYTSYVDSNRLLEHIQQLCEPFLRKYGVKQILRMGLRYVNQVELNQVKKVSDWSTYISDELLVSPFFLKSNAGDPLRFINQIELKNNSLTSTQLQYGVWNDQYPSPITNSAYIIDIDASTRLPIGTESDELNDTVLLLNKNSESIFELSIKEALRKEMNL